MNIPRVQVETYLAMPKMHHNIRHFRKKYAMCLWTEQLFTFCPIRKILATRLKGSCHLSHINTCFERTWPINCPDCDLTQRGTDWSRTPTATQNNEFSRRSIAHANVSRRDATRSSTRKLARGRTIAFTHNLKPSLCPALLHPLSLPSFRSFHSQTNSQLSVRSTRSACS